MVIGLLIYLACFATLQCLVGNLQPAYLSAPISWSVGIAFIALLYVLSREKEQRSWLRSLRSSRMACALLAVLVLWSIIGGCLPQTPHPSADGFWGILLMRLGFYQFPTSWPFVALLTALLGHLTLLLFHRLRSIRPSRDGAFLLTHGGVWLCLFGGLFGAPDTQEWHVQVSRAEATTQAVDAAGRPHALPYTLQLQDFVVERLPHDQTPTQYVATVLLDGEPVRLSINAPHAVRWGEDLYLLNYDRQSAPTDVRYCVLQVVRQPWKYVLFSGILLLLVGAGWTLRNLKPRSV